MKLNLKNPIVFFDLETTGTNINTDRIVEICYLKVYPNGNEETKTMRINPEMHIPEQSSAIHGIYDADVADCPTFKEVAKEIARDIEGCDLAGFNSNRFDIPVLAEEFLRAGVDIDMMKRKFIDVQVIYHKLEQRTLSAAYKFYCGKNLEDAHTAEADTRATYEVLKSQLDRYPEELQNDIEEKEQYLNELLKYDQMNNKLALLLKKQENVLWELKRYNGIQEWIKYFIQLKEVEEKLSTYNTSEFLLPGEEEEYQQLLKEKQTLRKKTKNIIKVDELEVLLHNGMDEMQVDFIKDDISNKMSETKLGLRELFNEINLLKGKIKNVADFVKANYESLHQSDSPVFAILNAIYI